MISSGEKREYVQLAVHSLAFVGCPLVALFSLYAAAYCFWMTAGDRDHPVYWELWMFGFVAAALASLALLLWLLIAPLVRRARQRRRAELRRTAMVHGLREEGRT